MEKLHILHLASWYPSREHTTIGNFVKRHVEAIAAKHRVTLVYAVESENPGMDIQQSENLCEIRVYFKKVLPLFSFQKAMNKGIKYAITHFGLPDIAHVHVAYPAGISALQLGIRYVLTEHFSGYHPESGYRWGIGRRKITRRILNGAERILPVSNHLGRAIVKFGCQTPYTTISNVVDTSVFYPAKTKSGTFKFLHISTLEERSKNIEGILKGIKFLQDEEFDFQLVIGGDGDLDDLNQKVKRVGINPEYIQVFGEKSIEEVGELMRQCHALLMFSHFENQPCTILEALCSGLPVISSDVGGIPEVLNDSNGILVEAENQEKFNQGLKQMLSIYPEYDLHKIAEEASSKYSVEAVSEALSQVYVNALR